MCRAVFAVPTSRSILRSSFFFFSFCLSILFFFLSLSFFIIFSIFSFFFLLFFHFIFFFVLFFFSFLLYFFLFSFFFFSFILFFLFSFSWFLFFFHSFFFSFLAERIAFSPTIVDQARAQVLEELCALHTRQVAPSWPGAAPLTAPLLATEPWQYRG